ncbi:Tetratricopeptide repeat-containing protein [Atopostipes suicloacalis DSM 15692]|uniref:Tetratricopeptide repeat-containing protein n=1 Tax=Atopostipes suicloacalis DSM 15692 TaxID=1121025 RepID=A0A1M4WCU7_9LACT|nr:helix-turn-helix domain-containing protein [Atopostipes suicloacalis]SHE79017.1 Tetratricopeptide repeat-containing protein [Atopostipes suicloacalis DSM 15692]
MDFGSLIKSKRKELGLTQKELSEGICTQALISRIEKGDIVPQNSILQQLGSRLQLNDKELSTLAYKTRYDNEIDELKRNIRRALTRRDYDYIEKILEQNKILINNTNNENDQAFFTWMNASLQDKLYNQKDKALKILTEIPLLNLEDELAIEILNAIGVIYYQGNEFKQALNVFQHAVSMIEDNIDYMVQTKLLFNYALTLEEYDEDKKALDYIIQAIERLIIEDSMYLLGDLYHTKGFVLRKLGHLEEAKKSNQLALSIFEIQNNIKFKVMTQLEIKEINHLLQKVIPIDYYK